MEDVENIVVKQPRLNKCHTFEWSRQLWKDAAKRTGRVALVLVVGYMVLGYFLLGFLDGMEGVDPWYYLAVTLTTVGIGDLYPSKQVTRGFAIVMLPFGLIVISFGISLATAQANATKKPLPSDLRLKKAAEEDKELIETGTKLLQRLQRQGSSGNSSGGSNNDGGSALDLPRRNNAPAGQTVPGTRSGASGDTETSFLAALKGHLSSSSWGGKLKHRFAAFKGTTAYTLCDMLVQYLFVLSIGVVIMFSNHRELRLQKLNNDDSFSFVDGLFFSTVIATTVGYGHVIVPHTDATKAWLIFYVFFATYKVGAIIGDLSGLYLSIREEGINDVMIDSTVWVHKADLDRDGKLSQADYVLFKLQQMQKVDTDMLERLIARFADLDINCEGQLDVGTDVPSKEQVKEMERVVKATGKTLPQLWREIQPQVMLRAAALADAELKWPGEDMDPELLPGGTKYVKLSECHDFKWSRDLWATVATETAYLSIVLVVAYLALGWYSMCFLDGIKGVDAWYFLSATLTTVGFGDFAPTTQTARGAAVVMIPFGLAIIGFGLSYGVAFVRGRPVSARMGVGGAARSAGANTGGLAGGSANARMAALSKSAVLKEVNKERGERRRRSTLQGGGGGGEQKGAAAEAKDHALPNEPNPSVAAAKVGSSYLETAGGVDGEEGEDRERSLSVQAVMAAEHLAFRGPEMEAMGSAFAFGRLQVEEFFATVPGKSLAILSKLGATMLVGAVFFKTYSPEVDRQPLTWVDACYWATVTATSIGYGDLVPQSSGGRLFLIFYMLVSTVVTAGLLGDFIDLYVGDVVGEGIISTIIDSTTWVHKADLVGDGALSEADYIMFKLQQMQKLDADMLDRLIDRFEELDVEGEGFLDVGFDVPSADQVKQLKKEKDDTKTPRTLPELWGDMKEQLIADMGGARSSAVYSAGGTRRPSVTLAASTGAAKRPSKSNGAGSDGTKTVQNPVSADTSVGAGGGIEMAPLSSS